MKIKIETAEQAAIGTPAWKYMLEKGMVWLIETDSETYALVPVHILGGKVRLLNTSTRDTYTKDGDSRPDMKGRAVYAQLKLEVYNDQRGVTNDN